MGLPASKTRDERRDEFNSDQEIHYLSCPRWKEGLRKCAVMASTSNLLTNDMFSNCASEDFSVQSCRVNSGVFVDV